MVLQFCVLEKPYPQKGCAAMNKLHLGNSGEALLCSLEVLLDKEPKLASTMATPAVSNVPLDDVQLACDSMSKGNHPCSPIGCQTLVLSKGPKIGTGGFVRCSSRCLLH